MSRSFFNADDLSLLIMEHPNAPQFLAVKIADAHDAAMAELSAELDALRGKLAGVDEKALEVASNGVGMLRAAKRRAYGPDADEQTRSRDLARAAIAAYLAALNARAALGGEG